MVVDVVALEMAQIAVNTQGTARTHVHTHSHKMRTYGNKSEITSHFRPSRVSASLLG
jgi:hypothetical protein